MEHLVVASDYDGTLASGGKVTEETLDAVYRLKSEGRKVFLVTGRRLEDLERVFPEVPVCDHVIAENGAIAYDPALGEVQPLAAPPPPAFAELLAERGVEPLEVGRVIVSTREPHDATVLRTIAELGLELQIIFNKGAVMVLPTGVNKGTALRWLLEQLKIDQKQVAAIGDAENDHSLFEAAGFPVAVANAVDSLKKKAVMVTEGRAGDGVVELIERVLAEPAAPNAFGQPEAGSETEAERVAGRESERTRR